MALMKWHHYDFIDEAGKRTKILTFMTKEKATQTEIDAIFEERSGIKATKRGVVVWWEYA